MKDKFLMAVKFAGTKYWAMKQTFPRKYFSLNDLMMVSVTRNFLLQRQNVSKSLLSMNSKWSEYFWHCFSVDTGSKSNRTKKNLKSDTVVVNEVKLY